MDPSQAHPLPGSLAELEDTFDWLGHEAEVRRLIRRGNPPERADRALEAAQRLIYREICRRAPIEVVARAYPPTFMPNEGVMTDYAADGYGAAAPGAFAPEPHR